MKMVLAAHQLRRVDQDSQCARDDAVTATIVVSAGALLLSCNLSLSEFVGDA